MEGSCKVQKEESEIVDFHFCCILNGYMTFKALQHKRRCLYAATVYDET